MFQVPILGKWFTKRPSGFSILLEKIVIFHTALTYIIFFLQSYRATAIAKQGTLYNVQLNGFYLQIFFTFLDILCAEPVFCAPNRCILLCAVLWAYFWATNLLLCSEPMYFAPNKCILLLTNAPNQCIVLQNFEFCSKPVLRTYVLCSEPMYSLMCCALGLFIVLRPFLLGSEPMYFAPNKYIFAPNPYSEPMYCALNQCIFAPTHAPNLCILLQTCAPNLCI